MNVEPTSPSFFFLNFFLLFSSFYFLSPFHPIVFCVQKKVDARPTGYREKYKIKKAKTATTNQRGGSRVYSDIGLSVNYNIIIHRFVAGTGKFVENTVNG
jgi:hypothetical protein